MQIHISGRAAEEKETCYCEIGALFPTSTDKKHPNDIKNVERRMFAFQRAKTAAQVHKYFDACMLGMFQLKKIHLLPKGSKN